MVRSDQQRKLFETDEFAATVAEAKKFLVAVTCQVLSANRFEGVHEAVAEKLLSPDAEVIHISRRGLGQIGPSTVPLVIKLLRQDMAEVTLWDRPPRTELKYRSLRRKLREIKETYAPLLTSDPSSG